jgi:NADP-dependent 3-hydroxy acid dehydrogenase YdfG
MDITDYKEVTKITKRFIDGLESKGEKLDVVVENAGLSMRC